MELKNIQINQEEESVLVSLNPKIYSLDVIYSASHSFSDENYIILDGDCDIEIVVQVKPKTSRNEEELVRLGREFANRVLAYQNYKEKNNENQAIRQILLKRAMITNSPEEALEIKQGQEVEEDDDDDEDKVPWEVENEDD